MPHPQTLRGIVFRKEPIIRIHVHVSEDDLLVFLCVCVCHTLCSRAINSSRGPGRVHRRLVSGAGDVPEDMEVGPGRHFHIPVTVHSTFL